MAKTQVGYFIIAIALLLGLLWMVRKNGECSVMVTHGAAHGGHAGSAHPAAHMTGLQCAQPMPHNAASAQQMASAQMQGASDQLRRQYIANGQCEQLFAMGHPEDGVVCADLFRYGMYPKPQPLRK